MVRRSRTAKAARAAVAAAMRTANAPRPVVVMQTGAAPIAGRKRRRRNRRLRDRQELRQIRNLLGNENNFNFSPTARAESVPDANYEPSLPSVTNVATSSDIALLNKLGSTYAGSRWALKALHPNGEGVTASAGVPDHTHVPVTTPEFRSNIVIGGLPDFEGNDDVDIIFPPCPDIACLWRRKKSAVNWQGNEQGWYAVYFPAVEKVPDSVIEFLNDDDGKKYIATVTGTKFGAAYSRARAMYKGATITLDAPALKDQGRIVAGQLAMDLETTSTTRVVMEVADPDNPGKHKPIHVTGIPTIDFGAKMPLDEDELFQVSPGTVVFPARKGTYLPLRFRDPVHLFNDSTPPMEVGTKQNPAMTTSMRLFTTGETVLTQSVDNVGPDLMFSGGGIDNMLTGVVLLRGIDGTANLQVKVRAGIEAQVSTSSMLSPFQHASPPLDRLALDHVTEIAQATPMAYEACYNDSNALASILKTIFGVIGPASRGLGKIGIPIVSDIAGGIGNLLEQLNLGAPPARLRLRR